LLLPSHATISTNLFERIRKIEDLENSTCNLIRQLGDVEEKLETYEQIIKVAGDLARKGLSPK